MKQASAKHPRSASYSGEAPRSVNTGFVAQCLASCLLACLSLSVGCAFSRGPTNAAPIAFQSLPTLSQVVDTINANSSRVHQLHAGDVRLSIPGQLASLTAKLDFDRERRFRLIGETRLTGREMDLGSNDEMFWMWIMRIQPPTVFYGRHDQFYQSAAQQILPMPPDWIVDALGIVDLDPNGVKLYQSQTTPGRLELRAEKITPAGPLLHVMVIDPQRGTIESQQILSANGEQLAVATASDFYHDPLQNVTLPRRVRVDLPPAGLSFRLEVPEYVINQPHADPMSLWSMPRMDEYGVHYRDVANPADMQGISLIGNTPLTDSSPDFYEKNTPVASESDSTIRSAFRRMSPFNVFLR